MSILALLVILVVIGVLLWALTKYIPMHQTIKGIIIIVGVIIAVLLVLKAFGVLDAVDDVQVPRLD